MEGEWWLGHRDGVGGGATERWKRQREESPLAASECVCVEEGWQAEGRGGWLEDKAGKGVSWWEWGEGVG